MASKLFRIIVWWEKKRLFLNLYLLMVCCVSVVIGAVILDAGGLDIWPLGMVAGEMEYIYRVNICLTTSGEAVDFMLLAFHGEAPWDKNARARYTILKWGALALGTYPVWLSLLALLQPIAGPTEHTP